MFFICGIHYLFAAEILTMRSYFMNYEDNLMTINELTGNLGKALKI
jgi:hypothetical protein